MNWVTVTWAGLASAGLTLGAVHLLVWVRRPAASAHLLFFLTCVGTAAFGICELRIMLATTPEEAGLALRLAHLPIWLLIVSLVGFVRTYLHAGRRWLGWAVCGIRTFALLLNFLFTPNLNYRSIEGLRPVSLLGESVSVIVGVPSPWMLVAQLSLLLLVAFVVDATVEVWRRGDRRKALVVGGGIVLFTVGGTVQSALVLWGVVAVPIVATLFYQGLVAAMGYELSLDVIRAARLSDALHEEQERIRLAAVAAKLALWTWEIPSNRLWSTPDGRAPADGAPPRVLTLEEFLESLHADDREPVRAAVGRALRDGADYEAEYRVALPGGSVRWIAGRGKVERDRQGQP
ncbi:MAG TPA: PAS domain-containing protein, partial [Gemmatimonadales bacterium]